MPAQRRVAGIIELRINGDLLKAVGSFNWNLGKPKREMVPGATSVDGYRETPQVAFIEGDVRCTARFDPSALADAVDITGTLTLANGDVVVLRNGVYANEGTGSTEDGLFPLRIEGLAAEYIKAAA